MVSTVVTMVLIAAAASNGVLAILALMRARFRPQALPFAGMCAALAVYASGYAFELASADLPSLYAALSYEYLGLGVLPALWILIARGFSGKPTSGFLKAALFGFSAVTIALVFTLPYHNLFYVGLSMTRFQGLTIISFGRAPWYWIQTVYLNLSMLYGTVQFGKAFFGKHAVRRSQAGMMLAGSIVPWIAYLFYLAGVVPLGLEPGSIALSISAPLFSFGFFKYKLFELAPLAREAVFEQMRDAVVVVDEDGRVADMNRAAAALPGMSAEFAREAVPLAEAMASIPGILAAYRGEASSLAVPVDIGGAVKRFDVTVSSLVDERGSRRGEAILIADATERAALADKLTEMANTDELTGLASRRRFFELARIELARARRYRRPFGLAIMDLDRFKQINDTYGHLEGDQALKLCAMLAGGCLRSCDTVGRIGGDEFAFLFPESDDEACRRVTEKVSSRIALGELRMDGATVRLSASFGWAGSSGPEHPEIDELFALADKRLYDRKAEVHREPRSPEIQDR